MPSDKDIVIEARKRAQYVADLYSTQRTDELLQSVRALADEVERLRKQLIMTAQDARHDAQAAADEAYWRDKQRDEYGSY